VSPEAQFIVISERSKFGDEGEEELCNLVCVRYSLFLFSSYERCDQEDALSFAIASLLQLSVLTSLLLKMSSQY
jgi:hypothetical protein